MIDFRCEGDTIQAALTQAMDYLSHNPNLENPRLDSELLLAHCLQKDRTWLKIWPEKPLSSDLIKDYSAALYRRLQGEPVAYIVGYKDFWTLTLKVTPDTLVPRPETETLVEQALLKISTHAEQDIRVADLGTGSGAIALAIARERPNAQVYAVEFSQAALAVAKKNTEENQIDNVTLVQNSWLDNWAYGELDVIVSNPPYVEAGDPHLEQLTHEPYQALVADDQGLADIKQISQQATENLKANGWLMFEHGFEQGQQVREILQNQGFCRVETIKDLAGQDRVTIGQYPV